MITTQELTDRQARFCEEYLIDLNATQAAIRAGYSEKTAREQAAQNLSKLNIQEKIAAKFPGNFPEIWFKPKGPLTRV